MKAKQELYHCTQQKQTTDREKSEKSDTANHCNILAISNKKFIWDKIIYKINLLSLLRINLITGNIPPAMEDMREQQKDFGHIYMYLLDCHGLYALANCTMVARKLVSEINDCSEVAYFKRIQMQLLLNKSQWNGMWYISSINLHSVKISAQVEVTYWKSMAN